MECAAAITLSLSAPAFAGSGDAIVRKARQTFDNQVRTVELGGRQRAEIGSGAFFDVNHSQTVESKRLKKRRFKQ